jgi:hypothetical protein
MAVACVSLYQPLAAGGKRLLLRDTRNSGRRRDIEGDRCVGRALAECEELIQGRVMHDLRVCICVWHGGVRGMLDHVHKQVVFQVLVESVSCSS